ncbi:MAG: T9SS type A sorting domain-containing protein [Candidatus Marinimicrobia bacterium]|nr:T9SS type A sorting domain-containing protein [Candidatus Neomarinimicrobiota bacterium]
MTLIRKILFITLLIAFALTPVFAKPADRQAVRTFLKPFQTFTTTSRPTRAEQYLSPGGRFLIHYDNSGYNKVPQDYTYNDSIPDFVIMAAVYLDESYKALKDTLGFKAPPTDNIESPEIDIYFRFDLTYYGVTQPENQVEPSGWTSYLYLSAQLEDSTVFYTYGLEGLRVTCAHELFHIFQLGYKYRIQDIFYFEMSSVWFEEYMYPEVNDYHSYVNEYAHHWNYAINSGALDYDNVGFNLYIDKRFSQPGNNIIHNIWDRILNVNALSAIRVELEDQGCTFEEALRDWGTAQVLCGSYSAENFQYPFNDASDLQNILFDNNTDNILAALSANILLQSTPMVSYYKITGLPDQILIFEALLDDGGLANLICLDGDQSEVRRIGSTPIVIDGTQFDNYILAVGADVNDMSGSFAFTALTADQMAALYPNPLHTAQTLNISYVLLEDNLQGQLAIYDLKGRKVYSRSMDEDLLKAGLHNISLIPQELSSGIYIIAFHFDNTVTAEKFTYLK